MGHGDRIAIVDRNYPATALHSRVHPLTGLDTVQAAAAILSLMPIDRFVEPAAFRMIPDGGATTDFDSHQLMEAALAAEGEAVPFGDLERAAFYLEARSAFAVITTSDPRPFSCFILTKGVVYEAGTDQNVFTAH